MNVEPADLMDEVKDQIGRFVLSMEDSITEGLRALDMLERAKAATGNRQRSSLRDAVEMLEHVRDAVKGALLDAAEEEARLLAARWCGSCDRWDCGCGLSQL